MYMQTSNLEGHVSLQGSSAFEFPVVPRWSSAGKRRPRRQSEEQRLLICEEVAFESLYPISWLLEMFQFVVFDQNLEVASLQCWLQSVDLHQN